MLSLLLKKFSELWYDGLVLLQVDECGCDTLSACTARPTDPVHVVYEAGWCLEIYHVSHFVYVDTPGCDIGADQYFGVPLF